MIKVVITEETQNKTILSVQMNTGSEQLLLEMVKTVLTQTGEILSQEINGLELSNQTFETGFGTCYELTVIRL